MLERDTVSSIVLEKYF